MWLSERPENVKIGVEFDTVEHVRYKKSGPSTLMSKYDLFYYEN